MERKLGKFIIIIIFIIRQITCRPPAHIHTSDLLGYLKHGPSNNPLIVILNAQEASKKLQDPDPNDLFITGDDGVPIDDEYVYENEAKEQAKHLLYHYLNAPLGSQESSYENPRLALRQTLRNKCQAVVECTSKCENKRKDTYCPLNCKAVFDRLDLCEQPKVERDPCEKKKDGCQKWGKTMPPRWDKC